MSLGIEILTAKDTREAIVVDANSNEISGEL